VVIVMGWQYGGGGQVAVPDAYLAFTQMWQRLLLDSMEKLHEYDRERAEIQHSPISRGVVVNNGNGMEPAKPNSGLALFNQNVVARNRATMGMGNLGERIKPSRKYIEFLEERDLEYAKLMLICSPEDIPAITTIYSTLNAHAVTITSTKETQFPSQLIKSAGVPFLQAPQQQEKRIFEPTQAVE